MHSTRAHHHHPLFRPPWSTANVAITLLLVLLFLLFFFLLLVMTAQPLYAQAAVPSTARQAARMPQFASRLRAGAGHAPLRTALPYQSRASFTNPSYFHAGKGLPTDDVVYTNGPINGTVDAWPISAGAIVSDTFTVLGEGASLGALSFGAWLFPGDVLQTVEVSITSDPLNGGTQYFDGVVGLSQSDCGGNQYGYLVCTEAGNFSLNNLSPGTYWINLQNATVDTGGPAYWDENSGPSLAMETSVGTIPSEAFTLLGSATTCYSCNPPPPCFEPGQVDVIHDFLGNEGSPGALATDRSGNLYGTSPLGGEHGDGMVYKLSHRDQGWVFTSLHSFTGGYDGWLLGSLIVGPDGIPYGASLGGLPSGGAGAGLVYRLRPPSHACPTAMCGWAKEVLYRFTGGADGDFPTSIVFDHDGHLYGTTQRGGAHGAGTVFQLTPTAGGWTETVIYSFPGGILGGGPDSLLVGGDGNLYGLAFGGVNNCGTYGGDSCGIVFQLVHNANGWTEKVLYAFKGTEGDGGFPRNLVQDSAGNLYGISTWLFQHPGIESPLTAGIEFKLSFVDGKWVFTMIEFRHSGEYYRDNFSGLVVNSSGNSYLAGTALLYDLSCGSNFGDCYYYADGANYINEQFNAQSLVLDEQRGRLYGVTPDCGAHGSGTVWKLGP